MKLDKHVLLIICMFLIWRVFIFLPLLLSPKYIPFNQINLPNQLWAFTRPYPPVNSILLYPWANFDGVHYLTIAGSGYYSGAEGRFFPFYPFLIATLARLFGQTTVYGIGQFFAGFLIANISFLFALLILDKLLLNDYEKNVSLWTILFILCFPVSFFFGSLYTESLFLLLSLLSLYFGRKKNFLLASLFGVLLTLTRSIGILIFFPILFELYMPITQEFFSSKKLLRGLPLLALPLALSCFMLFNYLQWHDALYFVHAQEAVTSGRSHLILFIPQTIYRYIKILISVSRLQFEWWIALLEITTFLLSTFLLYFVWKKKIYPTYVIFAVLCYLVPAISGTFSGFPRYASILFPIFIIPALVKHKTVKIALCVISLIFLFLLTMFYSRGYLVA